MQPAGPLRGPESAGSSVPAAGHEIYAKQVLDFFPRAVYIDIVNLCCGWNAVHLRSGVLATVKSGLSAAKHTVAGTSGAVSGAVVVKPPAGGFFFSPARRPSLLKDGRPPRNREPRLRSSPQGTEGGVCPCFRLTQAQKQYKIQIQFQYCYRSLSCRKKLGFIRWPR